MKVLRSYPTCVCGELPKRGARKVIYKKILRNYGNSVGLVFPSCGSWIEFVARRSENGRPKPSPSRLWLLRLAGKLSRLIVVLSDSLDDSSHVSNLR